MSSRTRTCGTTKPSSLESWRRTPGHPPHPRPAAALAGERHKAVADVEHHLQIVGDLLPADLRQVGGFGRGLGRRRQVRLLVEAVGGEASYRGGGEKHEMRHAGQKPKLAEDARDRAPGLVAA